MNSMAPVKGTVSLSVNVLCDWMTDGIGMIRKTEIINEYDAKETAMAIVLFEHSVKTCQVGYLSHLMFEVCQHLDGLKAKISKIPF